MFQRQPQPLPQAESPKFESSNAFDRLQIYSNSFFLSACGAGGILAVNLARVSPSYFGLIVVSIVAAIVTLAFFPNADNQQIRRIGIIALAVGLLAANWDLISKFKFQQIHGAISIGAVVILLLVVAVVGSARGAE